MSERTEHELPPLRVSLSPLFLRGGLVMTFDEILEQVLDILRRRGRVSYRALKRQFDLDDAYLADLRAK